MAVGLAIGLLALPAAAQDPHRGGKMRLLSRAPAGTIDPQVNYTGQYWQVFAHVYDGLLAFRKVPGPRGNEIVGDLAEDLPVATDGGLTWVFRLRPGIRFSDGTPVRAADVVASFRRLFRVQGPTAGSFYGAIAGADACLQAPGDCVLEGVSADEATITIRLSRPDPEFAMKLALPHASILPAGSPASDTGTVPLPGTGPYRIARYDPATGLRLERNPHFRQWSADAQPDGYPDTIDYDFGLSDAAEVTAILNGQADWMFDAPPADRLGMLGAHHAGQVHLNPAQAMWFVPLNTRTPPFDDVRVRRAFNMAVDRRAAVTLFGGGRMAQAACQVLPPGLPGYAPYCPYPLDLAAARQLVSDSGTAGQTVTLVTDDSPVARAIGAYLLDVLRDLGFVARLRSLSANVQ
ncbi:MAG: ABC transporter substrate-binding protein, partial [Gemmatimonadaceae bacterium]|nr:ABC transporter substrate-binding protein [Acetobacteraceae bacterium]